MKRLIDEEFFILTYREKYNLPLYDSRYMNLSEEEIRFDLVELNNFRKIIKEIVENENFEDDEDIEEVDDINEIGDNKKVKLRSGFTNEEIEEIWNRELK